MMVPRAFRLSSANQRPSVQQDEKPLPPVLSSEPVEPSPAFPAVPVFIPPRELPHRPSVTPIKTKPSWNPSQASRKPRVQSSAGPELPPHVSNLLENTTIPLPRTWSSRKRRRFPEANNVEDFSSLLFEGIKDKEGDSASCTSRKTSLDILLSPPNELEDDLFTAGSETPASIRSLSLDSVPSLDNDDDVFTPFSGPVTPVLSTHRTPSVRKQRVFSLSEACPEDHPLLASSPLCQDPILPDESPSKISADSLSSFRSFPKFGATVKSNLTASLRAIKSAAQSVSNFTAPSVRSEDFLTRSFFSFSPELTDDKHPRPMKNTPSPALRRYLNPFTASATDIFIYNESPRGTPTQPARCTTSIQMETYDSSTLKRMHRNHTYEDEADDEAEDDDDDIPSSITYRQREPRENSDFLRIVVLEMNMRRNGKLRSDMPGRAKVLLPPRTSGPYCINIDSSEVVTDSSAECRTPRRWIPVSVDG
ncbi:hypothetical protein FQN51_006677 [Onygenales sp. PD_10]|nr:hypothetical protein FQN51_006677 [Onygenales sp. PD_10]